MVNVGTGNVLLQVDDMNVPYKGVSLAFRRTYNSQSLHDVNADDAPVSTTLGTGANPAMFGNRWTNTFDAHMTWDPAINILTVYDIDGASYKYALNASQTAWVPATPGQYATLTFDGSCGYLWTKKSGTIYYFVHPDVGNRCGAQYAAYGGRLYEIVGRNNYLAIRLKYVWDTGSAVAGAKVSSIVAAGTDSAGTQTSATLAFGDVAGHRVLLSLTRPDGATILYYYYDNGDLWCVAGLPNNNGTAPNWECYATALSPGGIPYMSYAAGPRWTAANGTDSSYFGFGYQFGTSVATTNLAQIDHVGYVNPTVPDGTNSGPIQPSLPSGLLTFSSEFYTLASGAATLRDTDGHAMNWVIDGAGRATQTQECTATQGSQCTGTWLVTNESWDASNNLVSETDPRGGETDYLHDPMGNTTAVAGPMTTMAQGTFQPTQLYDYDTYNNVVAYCDANATHQAHADWTVPAPSISPNESLCQSQAGSVPHWRATYKTLATDPTMSYEPYGELMTTTSPSGYTKTFSYSSSQESGNEYGLPTSITGAQIPQNDAITPIRQPKQSLWYDATGNLVCYGTGNGQWLLTYDLLGRLTSTADPDDFSGGTGVCGKAGAQPNWNTVTRTSYFPDGSVSSKQTASQIANGVSTSFTYDVDRNPTTQTHYYGCTTVSTCTAGITRKFYDGADRLVEVSLPYDANDIQGYPMMTRYIYDLSQGGTTQYQNLGLQGHGNLAKTQELLSGTVITPFTYATFSSFTPYQISTGRWTDVRATSFDALDRPLASYEAAFANQPKLSNTYDAPGATGGPAQLGLLSSVTLATNEVKQYTYDAGGHLTDTSFLNDNGATSPGHVRYDASGHVVSRGTDALGNEVLQYDAAGELTSATKPASLGSATITYDYYSDGMRKDLNFSSTVYTASPLYQYAYRTDGRRSSLILNNGSKFTWTYTQAGRVQSQADPFTGKAVTPDNYYTVGKSPARHLYYPPSVTYVPETYSFDNYGRTIGVTLPAGVFSQSVTGFDLEDGVTGMSDLSVQAPTNTTTTICATSNVRNEKLPAGACNRGLVNGAFYDGAVFAPQIGVTIAPGSAITPWTLDARAGMLKGWQGQTLDDGNTSSGQFSYDASGRLAGDAEQLDRPWRASDGTMAGNRVYSTGTRTKTYDAENRLRSQQASPAIGATYPLWGENNPGGYWNDTGQGAYDLLAVDYSAENHPVRFAAALPPDYGVASPSQTFIWLWDGNDVLAQCNFDNTRTQCASYGFPVEGLATYYPSTGYVWVLDRGLSGQIAAGHDGTRFSGMSPVGRPSRNYFLGGINATIAPNSASPDDGDPPPPPAGAGISGTKIALDGWTFGNNTWQGVRTYDASVGQWNTPDAYAGDVHDPMSQKPFMWNHNNPYQYSDPSGYDAIYYYARQTEADFVHIFITVHKDDGKIIRYSFGPRPGERALGSQLVRESQDYDRGSEIEHDGDATEVPVYGSGTLAQCSGICTQKNGGFDEASLARSSNVIDNSKAKYWAPGPNSNTAFHYLCVIGGGGFACDHPDTGGHFAPGLGQPSPAGPGPQ